MTPTDPGNTLRLDDPQLPFDPESMARAVGAAMRRAHDGDIPTGSLGMAAIAAALVDTAEPHDGMVMETGPYLGRPVRELARLAAETVSVLPPAVQPSVAVRAGFGLRDCVLSPDGSVEIEGPRVAGDRELEIAAAAVTIGGRWGPAVVAPLLDAYGMELLDLRRLDTSQLLVSIAAELGVDLDAVAGHGDA